MSEESQAYDAPAAPVGGVVPYLSLDGANAAADFYIKAFGAKELGCIPPDEKGRTMHIHLLINGGSVMMSDFYPEHGHGKQEPQAFMLHLQVKGIDSWWRRAVEAGCTVRTALADAFWGDRYGQLTDPWSVVWTLGETPERKG